MMNLFKSKSSDKDQPLSLDDDDAKDFMEYLKEAQETDLREIERTGCVSQGRDMRNGNVIVMIPSLGLNRTERPELMFRKMLLLFLLKTHEMVGTAYSVVYAHTTIDIINQYPLIYKFYSILPRFYKKNLQKMYIIHPNIGIRAFFEFARIFLSHKFYNKLCLLETVLDFQRIIFPTQLPLSLKFLRKEDEEREVKYLGPLPSVRQSYINNLGAMEVLWICAEFLRENKGFQSPGIFRVPGDEGEISLAKTRLQYGYNADDPQNGWISLSENKKYIVIGNINDLYGENGSGGNSSSNNNTTSSSSSSAAATVTSESVSHIHPSHPSGTSSGSASAHTSLSRHQRRLLSTNNKSSSYGSNSYSNNNSNNESLSNVAAAVADGEVPTCSLVILNNNYTVAELFKLSIRELSDPLVPEDVTQDLLTLTRVYGSRPLDHVWEKAVAQRLADLPLSHLSTLIFIVRFLREVGAESAHNNMDTRNLSLVFAPTIFRFAMTDLIAATVDIKLIQSVMREIIERPTLLQHTVRFFREMYMKHRSHNSQENANTAEDEEEEGEGEEIDCNEIEQLLRVNPFLSTTSDMMLAIPIEDTQKFTDNSNATGEQLEDLISSGLSPAMVARMNRTATTRRPLATASDNEEEEENEGEADHGHRHQQRYYANDSPRNAQLQEQERGDTQNESNSKEEENVSNNRHFAMGRTRFSQTENSKNSKDDKDDYEDGGAPRTIHVMQDRDMHNTTSSSSNNHATNSASNTAGSAMRGRVIPPTPPARVPHLHQAAATHATEDAAEKEEEGTEISRSAVVLNGQNDRDALRLLEDLHISGPADQNTATR